MSESEPVFSGMAGTVQATAQAELPALTLAERKRADVVRVNEIFYSIQGEGSRAGERCVFVRLTGCGLRCTYCDTEYAFFEGVDRSVASVIEEVRAFDCNLVELTGGEPLEQQGAFTIMRELCDLGYDVMVETGGHIAINDVDPRVKRIVDFKTPSSGMMKRNLWSNVQALTRHDEVKFVIGNRDDYLWSKEVVETYRLGERVSHVIFSPVFGSIELRSMAEWIIEDQLPVRLQVQLHKLIWPDVLRGV